MARQYDERIPVMDNHCHLCFAQPIDESLRDYEHLAKRLSLSHINLLSCPSSSHSENGMDILENLKILYLKDRLSFPCFASAGFTWHFDEQQPYADFAEQMIEMGFDGFKALEMHPNCRRELGKGLNHPSFSRFFETLDHRGSTIVCHVGDPRSSWHLKNPSEEMIRLGRVYGDSHLSFDALQKEMEEVIARYRNMNFILAHFYFLSGDYEAVCRLLDENPHVFLDLTAGGEMYVNFSKDPALWRAFFLKYSDRIILGSDNYALGYGEIRYDLARNFLEGTEKFEYNGASITPICLPREVLDNIYWNNIHALMGSLPQPVNRALAYEHCLYILKMHSGQLTRQGLENLEVMTEYWKNAQHGGKI